MAGGSTDPDSGALTARETHRNECPDTGQYQKIGDRRKAGTRIAVRPDLYHEVFARDQVLVLGARQLTVNRDCGFRRVAGEDEGRSL